MMMQAVCGILKITKSDLHFWGQLNLIKQLQLEGKDSMVTILIVYHSQSGNTRKMAEAVARGAREIEGVKAILRRASETGDEDLLNCQGLVYAIFISAGNDGQGALMNIEKICLGYQFKKIHQPIVAKGPVSEEILARCEELGRTIAAGCEAGIY